MHLNTVEGNVYGALGGEEHTVDELCQDRLNFAPETIGTDSASHLLVRKGDEASLFGAILRVRCGAGHRQ